MATLPPETRHLFTDPVFDNVQELIEHGTSTEEAISDLETIEEILVAAGLASEQTIKSEYAAIDPDNRHSHGASGATSQIHGGEVQHVGWSDKKTKTPGRSRPLRTRAHSCVRTASSNGCRKG